MTHQAIRVSLILWQRLLKSLNAAVFTGMLCVGLYALVTNFAEARGAIGKALRQIHADSELRRVQCESRVRSGSDRRVDADLSVPARGNEGNAARRHSVAARRTGWSVFSTSAIRESCATSRRPLRK